MKTPRRCCRRVTPWLDEAASTREPRLRHGPEGAAEEEQRSCLVAPLVAQGELLGWLYADIEGAFGRFHDADRDLLAMLAALAAVALANLRFAGGLEAQVAERTAEARSAQADAEQRAAELALINGIQQGMARSLDFQAIVDLVGDKLREVFATGDLGIHWADESAHEIRFLYQVVHGRRVHPRPVRHFDRTHPLLVEAAAGRPVVMNSPAAAKAWGLYRRPGVDYPLSTVQIPVMAGDRPLGAIVLDNHERENAFGDAEVRLLTTIAASMGVALENARLHAETREALQQQTATAEVLQVISSSVADAQPVLDKILESCHQLIGAPTQSIMLIGEDGRLHRAARLAVGDDSHAGWGQVELDAVNREADSLFPIAMEGSATAQAIASAQVLNCPDVLHGAGVPEGVRAPARHLGRNYSQMIAPLVQGGRGIGSIVAQRPALGGFTPKEQALLKTFADQAVIAIQNAKMFRETNEALERQTATAKVLRVLGSSMTDSQPVFDAIVQSCSTLLHDSRVVLWLEEGQGLRAHANSAGRQAALALGTIPLDRDSPIGSCVLDARQLHLRDLDAVVQRFPLVRQMILNVDYHSGIFTPLVHEGRAIGGLAVLQPLPNAFNDKDESLLCTFADQAVMAIQNARLFHETQEALQRQTATTEVLQVINASPGDLAPVFDAIVGNALRLCDADGGGLWLVQDGKATAQGLYGGNSPRAFTDWLANHVVPVTHLMGPDPLAQPYLHIVDVAASPAYQKRLPIAVAFVELGGGRTSLFLPLVEGGRLVGLLNLTRQKSRAFSDPQIALLQAFATQAQIAMKNARLINETKETLEHQTATSEVLGVIASSVDDAQPVFDKIVDSGAQLFPNALALLITLVDAEERLQLAGVRFVSDASGPMAPEAARRQELAVAAGFPTPLAGSATERVIRTGQIVEVPDVANASDVPALQQFANVLGHNFAALTAPLMWEGKGIGAIVLSSTKLGPFSERQHALLKTFADQAVIAIQNAKMFRETNEALERQTATAEILKVIASSPSDVQPVFDAVADRARLLCGAEVSSVTRFDGEWLHMVSYRGGSPEAEAEMRAAFPVKPGHGSVNARAIVTAAPAQVPDIRLDPNYQLTGAVSRAGLRSMLGVPMLQHGQVIGVIGLGRKAPGPYSDASIQLLQAFADQAVIAIENTRLFNETQEALQRQTATAEVLQVISSSVADAQPVFDAIVRSAARLFGRKTALRTVEPEGLRRRARSYELTAEEFHGPELMPIDRHSLVGRAVLDGRTLQVADNRAPDTDGTFFASQARELSFRSIASAPLMQDGVAIGVISMSSPEPGALTEPQMALLSAFADQAVIAIQNARLFNETQEALAHQTASADILRVISSSPTDVQPVFEAIVGTAVKHLGCDLALVQTVSGDSYSPQAMATPAGLAPVPGAQLMPVDPAANFPSRAIRSKTMLHVNDWSAVELPPHEQVRHEQLGLNSALYLPLLRGDDCVGVLVLGSKKANAFNAKAIALAESFRDQALIAIENTRLFNETQEALAHQTVSADILRVISSSPTDVQPVFEAIVEAAVRLLVSDSAYVLRTDGNMVTPVAGANSGGRIAPLVAPSMPVDADHNFPSRAILSKSLLHLPDWSALSLPPLEQDVHDRFGMRSALFLPLMRGDECLGVLVFGRNKPREFSPKDIALAESFRDQAVIAIENTRLFNETQEALERQTATAEILAVISESPTDVQPVFQAIAERARTLCKADVGATTRLDGDIVHLAGVRALSTQAEDAMRGVFPMAVGAAPPNIRRAIVEQQPIQIADVHAEPGYPAAEVAQRSGFRSILSVPLLLQGRSIGTIGVARREPGRFADGAVALLQTFARQAVIAIENVRLFRETQEALEQQTASAEVLQVIGSSVADSGPVFDKILDSCRTPLSRDILRDDARQRGRSAGPGAHALHRPHAALSWATPPSPPSRPSCGRPTRSRCRRTGKMPRATARSSSTATY